jgi:hypothetical protein
MELLKNIKRLDLHYGTEYIISHLLFLQIIKKCRKGSKYVYNTLINNTWKKPVCERKWEKEFNIEERKNW